MPLELGLFGKSKAPEAEVEPQLPPVPPEILNEVGVAGLSLTYTLTGKVIASSFGSVVYLGADKASGTSVAFKVVQKPDYEGPEAEEELQRSLEELQVHATVPPHANILQLLAGEETPSSFLLVTPYMPDGNLWDLMKRSWTYSEKEVRNMSSQVLSALQHIHETCGLLHGDLKPHNLLLERIGGRYVVRLCDFGLARCVGEPEGLIEYTGLYGTPGWLAPEQLLESDFGLAVDLYACGLIIFQMLGGYAPFVPAAACLDAPAGFDERYWCHVGADCRDLLSRLLACDPTSRGTAGMAREHPWLSGPPPPEPSREQLSKLAASGGQPATEVCFWFADEAPHSRAAKLIEAPELRTSALGETLEQALQVLPCH